MRLAEMWRSACATPWKATNELRRMGCLPFIRLYFALHGVRWRSGWHVYGRPLIQRHSGSSIAIGDGFWMRNWFSSNPLGVHHRCVLATWSRAARIEIGDDVGMSGVTICAKTRVSIGDRVVIGANTTITDTDFHPLDPEARRVDSLAGRSEAVVIEDDCFIGMDALILKGARIGRGAVVGAGSVVTGAIPSRAVVAGNPACVIREL
jgi:acetyltransferase-like isoleucine patch superfamily enzyme